MKRNNGIYILLLLLLSVACTPRKSAEEGERFLQTALQQKTVDKGPDEEKITIAQLLNAEQQYRFTPLQRLQLKRLILANTNQIDSLQMNIFCKEAESIALQIGNDSLLCATRWDIFHHRQTRHDTAAALDVLQRQEPLVRSLYGEEKLKPYYYALAYMYNHHNRPASCFYWLRKARPETPRLLPSWYYQMAKAYLRFDLQEEALHYADSSLMTSAKDKPIIAGPQLVKGRALRDLGRTTEAMQFYAETVAAIDRIPQKGKKKSYSYYQQSIFYDYAAMLQQAARYREAIPLLTCIAATESQPLENNFKNSYYTNDIETPPINASLLLSQCYYSIGDKENHIRYARRADSLRNATNEARVKLHQQQLKEMNRNDLLSSRLHDQMQQASTARRIQYILLALVVLLTGMLVAAALWWHKRRLHLRRLYNEMAVRYADWLKMQMLLTAESVPTAGSLMPHADCLSVVLQLPAPASDTETTPSADMLLIYRRIYHQVLEVMEIEKPFLNPKLDLVSLARLAGTNRTQLSLAINQQGNTTFSNWLAAYRVNYLIQQIDLQPDLYIDELYPLAGFASRTSFYRQFRQVTGLTPKQYMKERSR